MNLNEIIIQTQPHINLSIEQSTDTTTTTIPIAIPKVQPPPQQPHPKPPITVKRPKSPSFLTPVLTNLHAGYFRITLSLCAQALLWKILKEPLPKDCHAFRRVLSLLPSTAFALLWSISLFTLASLSFLYILRCLLHFPRVKSEFLHHVGVNYLFAPWISWLLLLQSTPFIKPKSDGYYFVTLFFWWLFVVPILVLDVKIYGQWFTKGKRFVSVAANPTSQLSVIGNLVAAQAAARIGWKECAVAMFSLGMAHYLVLFVTLYQRLAGSSNVPAMMRPVFFLFIAAPSMGSLAWDAIRGEFDTFAKMLFFLSLFLFMSLVRN